MADRGAAEGDRDLPQSTFVASAENLIDRADEEGYDRREGLQEAKKHRAARRRTSRRGGSRSSPAACPARACSWTRRRSMKKALELLGDQDAGGRREEGGGGRGRRAAKKDPAASPAEVSEADYVSRFVTQRQEWLVTLAQIYEKRGKAADAEKIPRRVAAAADRRRGGAEAGRVRQGRGPSVRAARHLTVATLVRVTAASRGELEALYEATRGGSRRTSTAC